MACSQAKATLPYPTQASDIAEYGPGNLHHDNKPSIKFSEIK